MSNKTVGLVKLVIICKTTYFNTRTQKIYFQEILAASVLSQSGSRLSFLRLCIRVCISGIVLRMNSAARTFSNRSIDGNFEKGPQLVHTLSAQAVLYLRILYQKTKALHWAVLCLYTKLSILFSQGAVMLCRDLYHMLWTSLIWRDNCSQTLPPHHHHLWMLPFAEGHL